MDVKTGVYSPAKNMVVTAWRKPDADGDGEEVWEDDIAEGGQVIGRRRVLDRNGEPIFHYKPPEGFRNLPSFDHVDNYVRTDERGRIQRNPKGEAVGIRPGTVLVEYADGTSQLITDEYEQYLFAKAHGMVQEGPASPTDITADKQSVSTSEGSAGDSSEVSRLQAELDELRERLDDLEGTSDASEEDKK